MKQVFLLVTLIAAGLCASAQLVPVDSVAQYSSKNITVFGMVNATQYSDSTAQDTMYLKLAGSLTNQHVTLIIYPECRVKFGYRPDMVLLNKTVYVSGILEAKNGSYQMEIQSPFDIAFSPAKFRTGGTSADLSKQPERRNFKQVTIEARPPSANPGHNKMAQNAPTTPGNQIYKVVDSLLLVEKQSATRTVIKDMEEANRSPAETKSIAKTKEDRQNETNTVIAASQAGSTTGKQQQAAPGEGVAKEASTEMPSIKGEARLKANASIKSGPGKYFAVYGYLKKGDKVNVLLRHTEWSKIATKQAQGGKVIEGFVKSDELQQ